MAVTGCTLCGSYADEGPNICPIRGNLTSFRNREEANEAAERGCVAGVRSRAAYRAWDKIGRR